MLQSLKSRVPPLFKVLWSRYGLRSLQSVGIFLFAVVSGGTLVGLVAAWSGRLGPPLLSAFAALAAALALRAFDILGKMFICQAVVYENMSDARAACRAYGIALRLVRETTEALRGLVMNTRAPARIGYLERMSKRTRGTADGETAQFVCAALEEFASPDEALRYLASFDHIAHAGVALAEARLLLKKNLPRESLERLQNLGTTPRDAEVFAARSMALSALARDHEALVQIDKAIEVRGFHADYHLNRAVVLERLGRYDEAIESLNRSIRLHEKNPEALLRKGLLSADLGKTCSARRSLRESLFYDNGNLQAFLKLETMSGRSGGVEYDANLADKGIRLSVSSLRLNASVGESLSISVCVASTRTIDRCYVTVLEPYGGGLEARNRIVHLGRLDPSIPSTATFQVKANRPTTVNLGNAWQLVFVCTCSSGWASLDLSIDVADSRPGEVFLVLTEDHELGVRGRKPLTAVEAQLDLVQKARIAHLITRDFGVKWTHLVDAGTGLGLMQWAAGQSGAWNALCREVVSFYREAYADGHDLQLHLHLSAEPDSSFFCYRYNPETDALSFNLGKKNSNKSRPQISSWANVVSVYGTIKDPNSRVGSLAHAKQRIVKMISEHFPAVTPVFFRAGQWDFGISLAEREKSALALREIGILADSSATKGDMRCRNRFGFGSPPEGSPYFARRSDINERASTLAECGITEALPLLMPQGKHPVTPREDPSIVVRAYKKIVHDHVVRPGPHVLMEIEHLSAVSDTATSTEEGSDIPGSRRDWKAIRRHFQVLQRDCPLLQFARARDALEAWWDYYSPQIIVLPLEMEGTFHVSSGRVLTVFRLRFLGCKAIGERNARMPVVILLPLINRGGAARIRIMRGKALVWHAFVRGRNLIRTNLPLTISTIDDWRLEVEPGVERNALRSISGRKHASSTREKR